MSTDRFNVGRLQCATLDDGEYTYPHPAAVLFADAPREELATALAEWNIDLPTWESWNSSYTCLLLDTGQHKVLVDTGAGKLGPSTGQLVSSLLAVDVVPDEIDTVVLTHAHPDHIGGLVDASGQLVFDNARHVMSQTEWDFWSDAPDLSSLTVPDDFKEMLVAFASQCLAPLANRVEFVSPGDFLADGVEVIDLAGHTQGQIGLKLVSEGQGLLVVGDAFVHPIHVTHPEWCTAIDYCRETTIATRERLLHQARTENAGMFAFHFPEPAVGSVASKEGTCYWRGGNGG